MKTLTRSALVACAFGAFLSIAQAALAQPVPPAPPAPAAPSNQIECVPIGGEWSDFNPESGGSHEIGEAELQKVTQIEGGVIVEFFMWNKGDFDYRITKKNADKKFWDKLKEYYIDNKDVEIEFDENGKITDVHEQ